MLIDTRIAGIPGKVEVSCIEPPHPGGPDEPPSPGELGVEVLDRRGKPARWLERKVISDNLEFEVIADEARKAAGADRAAVVTLV